MDKENKINIYIGDKIRSRRHKLGMSQAALGQKIGVTFQQVQKYEKGVNKIVASKLFHIANNLDVPISYFFEGLSLVNDSKQNLSNDSAFREEPLEFNYEHGNDQFSSVKESMALVKAFNSIDNKDTRKKLLVLMKTLA
ncbi:MAG: helix-turn-helix transcriptional regulator [Pseudomonadota bacterium]